MRPANGCARLSRASASSRMSRPPGRNSARHPRPGNPDRAGEDAVRTKEGGRARVTVGHAKKTEKKSVEVNYDKFADDVNVGDTVLVDNGLIKLTVTAKKKNRVL